MWQKIGSWLRGRPVVAETGSAADWSGERTRHPRPAYDRALRRAPQDWPGAGEAIGIAAPRLAGCRSWIYQIQSINWERIEASVADVAVIDASSDGRDGDGFSLGQFERMRARPGGGDTLLLCRLSIGAAEPWRGYWQPKWQRARPGWIDVAPGEWDGSAIVRYWDQRWQDLVIHRPNSLLNGIIAAGFDGVVLDGIDAFQHFRAQGRQSAPDEMIELVTRIGAHVWPANPNFLVVPLNGEELLGSPRYRSVISAQIREDVLFRPDHGAGHEAVIDNNEKIVAGIMGDLGLALADDIPVLVVEYLRDDPADAARIAPAAQRLRGMGLVPYFAPRRLNRAYAPPA